MAAPLHFFGGSVVTCDSAIPTAESVLVANGRIAAVGPEHEVRDAARAIGATDLNLSGAALLPGFIDAHHHFLFAALDRRGPNLRTTHNVTGIDDLLAVIQQHAATSSGWVRVFGYTPLELREHRHPTRLELDRACPDRPLLLAALGWHAGSMNSAGFDAMGWLPPTAIPAGGAIPLGRDGLPRGDVYESALYLADGASRNSLVTNASDAWIAEAQTHAQELAACGITRVGDAAVSPEFDLLYERAVAADMLCVTVHRMPIGRSLLTPRTTGPATGSGPGRTPVGAAKLFLDGGEACAMCLSAGELLRAAPGFIYRALTGSGLAAIRATTNGDLMRLGRDLKFHRGIMFWDQHTLESTITDAANNGLQVAQHAIGNEAIDQATRAINAVAGRLTDLPGRPRLEHTMLCGRGLATRMANLGAIAVVSPIWLDDLRAALRTIPYTQSLTPIPLRTMIDAGVTLSGASDYPSGSFHVLHAIQTAVIRQATDGTVFGPHEAITAAEALQAFTMGSAQALGVDDIAGSIAVGKQADLVVLERNPLETAPDRIASIAVLQTYLAGAVTYSRTDAAGQSG